MSTPAPCEIRVEGAAGESLLLQARVTSGTTAAAVIAPPNPHYGGTIDNLIVAETIGGLRQAGAATLTFNYRGVERSHGALQDNSLEIAVGDYGAALSELASRAAGPYYAAGYSFGAGVALLAARDAAAPTPCAGAILIAPPVGLLQPEDLRAYPGKIFVLVGDDDEYAPLDALKAILAARPDITLTVLPGADHFFHYGGLHEIAPRIAEQLRLWQTT
jgi:alpha/beta superfamily hydrolase